jgi:hypothetical protein
MPPICLRSIRGGGAYLLRLVEAERGRCASVDLVEATLLLIKCPLEGFRCLRRLEPPMMKMPAGYWHSRPFG